MMRESRGLVSGTAAVLGLCCSSGVAAAGDYATKAEIAELAVCYAIAADTLGEGKTQADPATAGLAMLRKCFTEDATFAIWPAGTPFDSLTSPSRTGDKPPAVVIPGLTTFASAISSSFAAAGGVGYDFVQHKLSNIVVDVEGDSAKLNAYVESTHVIQATEPFTPTRCRQQTNGTYTMKAKKIEGKWLLTSFDLAQIAFDTIIENGDGCSAPAP